MMLLQSNKVTVLYPRRANVRYLGPIPNNFPNQNLRTVVEGAAPGVGGRGRTLDTLRAEAVDPCSLRSLRGFVDVRCGVGRGVALTLGGGAGACRGEDATDEGDHHEGDGNPHPPRELWEAATDPRLGEVFGFLPLPCSILLPSHHASLF